jgi:hypothetical protein
MIVAERRSVELLRAGTSDRHGYGGASHVGILVRKTCAVDPVFG